MIYINAVPPSLMENPPTSRNDSLGVVVARVVEESHQRVITDSLVVVVPVAGVVEEKPPTSRIDSLEVVVAGVVEESHQRVILTRWWWWWPAPSMDSRKRPPTSHYDSLVVVVAGVVDEQQKKTTNES